MRSEEEEEIAQNFWVLLNVFQVFHCVLLLEIDIKSNLIDYMRPINFTMMNLNIVGLDLGNKAGSDPNNDADEKMRYIGNQSSNFIENYFLILGAILVYSLVHALFKLF